LESRLKVSYLYNIETESQDPLLNFNRKYEYSSTSTYNAALTFNESDRKTNEISDFKERWLFTYTNGKYF